MGIPEAYGGVGTFLDLIVVLEEAGRALLPGPYFSTMALAVPVLIEAGTEVQKKEALNAIEDQSPGAKSAFYFGFLDRVSSMFTPVARAEQEGLRRCAQCGAPTPGEVCAFCKLVDRAARAGD